MQVAGDEVVNWLNHQIMELYSSWEIQAIFIRPFPGLVNFVLGCLPLPSQLVCSIFATWERPYGDSLYLELCVVIDFFSYGVPLVLSC